MIELVPVVPENYRETLDLGVAPEQEHLIAPVVKSLSDAFVWRGEVRVAKQQERLVGFVMVFAFEDAGDPVINIVRLLIDRRHQGRGLGRELVNATFDWIGSFEPRPVRARISTFPENSTALALYRSAGFEGSEIEDGEVVLWRPLAD